VAEPSRRSLLLGLALLISGCSAGQRSPGRQDGTPALADDAFIMSDGARLPMKVWRPEGSFHTVVLALHGSNDSRNAWDVPAPHFAAAGMIVYAPDQRGFGAAPMRGLWPGRKALIEDATEMVGLLRYRHPEARMVLMGESMGGAVLMGLATQLNAPEVHGYVLAAPAVWDRTRLNWFERIGFWLAATLLPGWQVSRPPASNNADALARLSRDPLAIGSTGMGKLYGLANLMDKAMEAAPRFTARALFQYGAYDDLISSRATRAMWRALPAAPHCLAYYRNGWHLLFRDLDGLTPINDAIAWILDPSAPLPSGADVFARAWLSGNPIQS